jgi:hypothetical protein
LAIEGGSALKSTSLEAAEEWLFLCSDGEIAGAIARCTELGLNTDLYSAKTIKRVAKGQRIIVVSGTGSEYRS